MRDIGGDKIEQVELLYTYENANKFGVDNKSYAYRITYRSIEKTLTNEEVDKLHKTLEEATVKTFSAKIR